MTLGGGVCSIDVVFRRLAANAFEVVMLGGAVVGSEVEVRRICRGEEKVEVVVSRPSDEVRPPPAIWRS